MLYVVPKVFSISLKNYNYEGVKMVYMADRDELSNILLSSEGMDILNYSDRILELVPELIVCSKCDHEHIAHKYNVYIHILHVVSGVNKDLSLKLAALFHDIGKPYAKKKIKEKVNYRGHPQISVVITELVLKRLGYDKAMIDEVCTLVKLHDEKVKPEIGHIKLVVDKIGKVNFERLMELQTSDISAHADEYASVILPKLEKVKEVYAGSGF